HVSATQTFPISGELPATDGACGVRHGPFTVGPGVRALSGFAAATVNTNDEILKLFFGDSTTPLIAADTLFSPEQFRYAPAGGVPPGDYFVQNCDFPDGAAWTSPRTYTGTVTIDDSRAPPAPRARWEPFPAPPPPPPAGGWAARKALPAAPAAVRDRPVPVERPEHRHAQDVVLALGPGLRHR